MPARTRKPAPAATAAGSEVEAFLATLEHPAKDALLAVRDIILAADARIAEGIKWNAPSFRTHEYFATFHLREKQGLSLILHFGARKNAIAQTGAAVADPVGLLHWLAKDRAMLRLAHLAEVRAKEAALGELIRDWIRHV